MENILIIRSAPLQTFAKVLSDAKIKYPRAEYYGLCQPGIESVFREAGIPYMTIPQGRFLLNKLPATMIEQLKTKHFKRMVIPVNNTKFKGYDEIVRLGFILNIKECVLVDENLRKRKICVRSYSLEYGLYILISFMGKIAAAINSLKCLMMRLDKKAQIKIHQDDGPRVAIFSYHYIPTSPVVIPVCAYLIDRGYKVDWYHLGKVRNRDHDSLGPSFRLSNKELTAVLQTEKDATLIQRMVKQLRNVILQDKIFKSAWRMEIDPSMVEMDKYLNEIDEIESHYNFIVGFEERGLAFARKFVEKYTINSPLIYWNLELNMKGVASYNEYLLRKAIEKYLERYIRATVIQDDFRKASLEKTLLNDYTLVPTSLNLDKKSEKTNYLRNKYKIPQGMKIILYAGSILPFHYLRELISSAIKWKPEWYLIIHGKRNIGFSEELESRAKNIKNIIFSNDVLPYEEFYEMLASADIGIALFNEIDDNLKYTAFAAGKIAQYLRCGIPIILNENRASIYMQQKYKCAELIKDWHQIYKAIENILNDYSEYRKNAFSIYDTHYRIEPYIDHLISKINCA